MKPLHLAKLLNTALCWPVWPVLSTQIMQNPWVLTASEVCQKRRAESLFLGAAVADFKRLEPVYTPIPVNREIVLLVIKSPKRGLMPRQLTYDQIVLRNCKNLYVLAPTS